MHSTLIVARMDPSANVDVAKIFGEFDDSDMPHLMGTRRRQLFHYRGLYFHLQDFDETDGADRIETAKTDPRFVAISEDLKPLITAYDPTTWKSPADAMAIRFYDWQANQ